MVTVVGKLMPMLVIHSFISIHDADVKMMLIFQKTTHCYNDASPPDFGVCWTMHLDS